MVSLIVLLLHQLRSHVAGSSAEDSLLLHLTVRVSCERRKPEVDELDVKSVLLDQNIFKLDISVCDAERVQVAQSTSQLLQDLPHHLLILFCHGLSLHLHKLIETGSFY